MHLLFESAIVCVWFLSFAICIGIGLIALRLSKLHCENSEELLLSFWIGWIFLIGILQIWHIIFPVNLEVAFIIMIISATGLIWNWKSISTIVFKKHHNTIILFILALIILVLSIGATLPCYCL